MVVLQVTSHALHLIYVQLLGHCSTSQGSQADSR